VENDTMKKGLTQFLMILALILFVIFHFMECSKKRQPSTSGEKVREYANVLYNRELYSQAIREYQRYLDYYDVDNQQRANINFIIGNIYFDRVHDYENAMAYYLKIKHMFPESNILPQVDKQIVACLERLQRSADAKQALDEATNLEPESVPKSHPGSVIAKIGDREITSGDLKYHIGQLPDYLQSQFRNKEARVNFLKQFVATELFYDAAKRKGLEKDKDVVEGTFQAKKSLMVQKYLEEEIANQIQISSDDFQLYYKANKDKYVEKDDQGNVKRQKSYEEVQKQVSEDLVREKQQKAYEALLERMMTAEKVKVYEDLVE
jgi:tetratricopeptide (TPR) repeat protein